MSSKVSKVGGGLRVASWAAGHTNGAGELISAQMKRGRWFLYFFGDWDRKRVNYCEKHRHDHVPDNFREGQFSLSTILLTIKLMFRGEWDGL